MQSAFPPVNDIGDIGLVLAGAGLTLLGVIHAIRLFKTIQVEKGTGNNTAELIGVVSSMRDSVDELVKEIRDNYKLMTDVRFAVAAQATVVAEVKGLLQGIDSTISQTTEIRDTVRDIQGTIQSPVRKGRK